ncbi:MAG: hypothetical protein ACM34A_16275, partial [Bacillota bacterium]
PKNRRRAPTAGSSLFNLVFLALSMFTFPVSDAIELRKSVAKNQFKMSCRCILSAAPLRKKYDLDQSCPSEAKRLHWEGATRKLREKAYIS